MKQVPVCHDFIFPFSDSSINKVHTHSHLMSRNLLHAKKCRHLMKRACKRLSFDSAFVLGSVQLIVLWKRFVCDKIFIFIFSLNWKKNFRCQEACPSCFWLLKFLGKVRWKSFHFAFGFFFWKLGIRSLVGMHYYFVLLWKKKIWNLARNAFPLKVFYSRLFGVFVENFPNIVIEVARRWRAKTRDGSTEE